MKTPILDACPKSHVEGDQGFSLIEVMMGFAMTFIAMQAVTSGLVSAQKLGAHQRQVTDALSLAESTMEEIFLMEQGDADLAAGPHIRTVDRVGGGGQYEVQWVITPNTPIPLVNQIDLEVRWKEGGVDRQIAFRSHRS